MGLPREWVGVESDVGLGVARRGLTEFKVGELHGRPNGGKDTRSQKWIRRRHGREDAEKDADFEGYKSDSRHVHVARLNATRTSVVVYARFSASFSTSFSASSMANIEDTGPWSLNDSSFSFSARVVTPFDYSTGGNWIGRCKKFV